MARSMRTALRLTSAAATPLRASVLRPQLSVVVHQRQLASLSEKFMPPFTTLAELMEAANERYSDRTAAGIKTDGEYKYMTYGQVYDQVVACRGALAALGVGKGDKVAIISRNRIEWVLSAYAGYSLGAVHVPMYEQQQLKDWEYICQDSGAKVLITSTVDIYNTVKAFPGSVGQVERVLCCDLPADHPDSFQAHLAHGREHPAEPVAVAPEDLATLIYTSGTTGTPKGVMLSHNNLCFTVKATLDHARDERTMAVTKDDRSLAFLPWAHSYGQTCELHSGIAIGGSMGIAAGAPGDVQELLLNISEVQPTILFSVPTLFNKVYDGFNTRLAQESDFKRRLMTHALDVGNSVRLCKAEGRGVGPMLALQHAVLDRVVLSKIRERFGGKLRCAFTAGAPVPVEVLEFMESIGISMGEGYGLTETSPVVSVTTHDPAVRINGTVGSVLPGVRVKLMMGGIEQVGDGAEGELWVSGANVMQGYWNRPAETAEVFVDEADGTRWFRTGDLATLLHGEHIKITGRIKEQFKLENGKYVVPAPIEAAICLNRFVAQAVIWGDGKPHNVAVLVPDYLAVAEHLGLENDPAALKDHPAVAQLLEEQVLGELASRGIKKYEWPKKWIVLDEPFSAANEMLTPKLSVRKPNVIKAYRDRLEALYRTDKVEEELVA